VAPVRRNDSGGSDRLDGARHRLQRRLLQPRDEAPRGPPRCRHRQHPRYLAQARLAAEVESLDIEFHNMSVYEVPQLGERFDLVLFLGVLYHLRYPLLALDILRDHAVGRMLVFQSMLRGSPDVDELAEDYDFNDASPFDSPSFPRMHFVERKYAGDPTNWWIPNQAAAAAMLRSAGFEITAHPEDEVFVCQPASSEAARRHEELPWLKP